MYLANATDNTTSEIPNIKIKNSIDNNAIGIPIIVKNNTNIAIGIKIIPNKPNKNDDTGLNSNISSNLSVYLGVPFNKIKAIIAPTTNTVNNEVIRLIIVVPKLYSPLLSSFV